MTMILRVDNAGAGLSPWKADNVPCLFLVRNMFFQNLFSHRIRERTSPTEIFCVKSERYDLFATPTS
jgi:hypothetical protein